MIQIITLLKSTSTQDNTQEFNMFTLNRYTRQITRIEINELIYKALYNTYENSITEQKTQVSETVITYFAHLI